MSTLPIIDLSYIPNDVIVRNEITIGLNEQFMLMFKSTNGNVVLEQCVCCKSNIINGTAYNCKGCCLIEYNQCHRIACTPYAQPDRQHVIFKKVTDDGIINFA